MAHHCSIRSLYLAAAFAALLSGESRAFDGLELYAGERELYQLAKKEGFVVSYDTGPEWANWKSLFREFAKRYPGIELTHNDLGSAATVTALENTRKKPLADTAYYFAASAVDATKKDLVASFKPNNFVRIDPIFKDYQGKWFTVHSLNIAFLINTKLVKNVPTSWADLLKPEYKNSVVYLDPRSAGVGQVVVFAAAFAAGGGMENTKPGIDYLSRLHATGNVMSVETTSPYAKFLRGEIPIWIGYENDGLKAKFTDAMGDSVSVVIPTEASAAAPYAMSLVKNGPNPNAGKLWLNFILSDPGQILFAQGFVRPVRLDVRLPTEVKSKLPYSPQIRFLSIEKAMQKKSEIDASWAAAVSAK
jgi:putative spermidine/putrescine transport system substrate-binding protein